MDKDNQKALRICQDCPVMWECLEYAMRNEEESPGSRWGIYGGTRPEDRARIGKRAALRALRSRVVRRMSEAAAAAAATATVPASGAVPAGDRDRAG